MSFANSLKHEIARVSRKEIRANTDSTRRAVTQFRRDIAELKRVLKAMERRVNALEKEDKKRAGQKAEPKAAEGARFAAKWVRSHRNKIGLSQADYARLVGVSTLTIYNWESSRTRPRGEQLASWAAVRQLGKREAGRRLELLD